MKMLLIFTLAFAAASTQSRALKSEGDDDAWIYWSGGDVAAVYLHHVDFYKAGDLIPALAGKGARASSLRGAVPAHGDLRFIDAKDRVKTRYPVSSRAFTEGIRSGGRASRHGDFLVCTDAAWGVAHSTAPEMGFCGAFGVDGKEIFHLDARESDGIARIPSGISDDGGEALFSLTKARAGGDREIAAYLLWSGKGTQTLSPDSPRAKALLQAFEGRLVLPSVESGSGGD